MPNRVAVQIIEKFFLGSISAISFLTVYGAIISPLPIVYAMKRLGRVWGYLFLAINTLLVMLLAGKLAAFLFVAIVGAIAVGISEFSRLNFSVEKIIVLSLSAVLLISSAGILGVSAKYKVNPVNHVTSFANDWVENFAKSQTFKRLGSSWDPAVEQITNNPKEVAKTLLQELPSSIVIGLLLIIVLNLFFLIRVNPDNIVERLGLTRVYFQTWKSPEYLIFPVIGLGIFLLFDIPYVSKIALNLFKILMSIYFFQGLSIVYFFFERLKVTIFWRVIGYCVLALMLIPLVISLGFFDLWFDFRTKFTKNITSGGNDESNIN